MQNLKQISIKFKSYEHVHKLATTGWTDAKIKKGGFACHWLGNVGMHMNAKCDQNIPSGSRVMSIFTN